MYKNMMKSGETNGVAMVTELRHYQRPCVIPISSWLSDEPIRAEISDNDSIDLSAMNYTSDSTCKSTSGIQNIEDISNITDVVQSRVENWVHNQPHSSTPKKKKSVPRGTLRSYSSRRHLFTTDKSRDDSVCLPPPTSERPPCIGADHPDEPQMKMYSEFNYQPSISNTYRSICTDSIQSDDTLFMENELYALPVTYTTRQDTLLRKIKRVTKHIQNMGHKRHVVR